MEIKAIKERLSIEAVAQRLNIQFNAQGKAHCPFHEDKTPSFQLSKEKNIATCFSSKCNAGTMDIIGLTEKKLKLTKHEALKLLTEWAEQTSPTLKQTQPTAITNYQELYAKLEANYKRSSKAKEYAISRGLTAENLKIGYNATSWGKMKHCIIFPLRNNEHQIVSFYGRSIVNNEDQAHYYLSSRTGLYPSYPKATTSKLILTESIIDAQSLLESEYITNNYSVLACYGVNGFSQEHEQALQTLQALEEITICFDGDASGKQGAEKLKHRLTSLTKAKVNILDIPDTEDVNSLLQGHGAEIFEHLLTQKNKPAFIFSEEKSSKENQEQIPTSHNALNTDNAELLTYKTETLFLTLLGGIKLIGLDKLRVTIKVEHKTQRHLLPIRHHLDLYHRGQVEQFSSMLIEGMELGSTEVKEILSSLTGALEHYRRDRLEALRPKVKAKPVLSPKEKEAALTLLTNPNLIEETKEHIFASGLVGEKINAQIAYYIYTSRKREHPLQLICMGSSGSGKTWLQERVSALIPEEDILAMTTVSENALYYFGKEELKHKLILIEDLDGAQQILYPLRELQSKRSITKTVTLKDSKGNLKTISLTVEGPVCVSGCTTKENLYEDNANRSILLYTDMSKEQDDKIMSYQRAMSSGKVNKQAEEKHQTLLQNAQRLLRPIAIRNPYADLVYLPQSVFKPRRTMLLLLNVIETITFYHQYQRTIKEDDQTGEQYIETTARDIEYAFELMEEVLFSKSDELSHGIRSFYEQIKVYLKQEKQKSFYGQELRKHLGANPRNVQRYLQELRQYGYIKIMGGNRYRKGLEYTLIEQEENIKEDIGTHLKQVIERVRQSDTVRQ